MGQTWGAEAPETPKDPLRAQDIAAEHGVTKFQRLSLKINLSYIDNDATRLLEILGIVDAPGADVMLRMARSLTQNRLHSKMLVAIGWLDGRIAEQLGLDVVAWRRVLFEAASSAEVGGEAYIPFDEMFNLIWLIVSAFDRDPLSPGSGPVEILRPRSVVEQILRDIKVPLIAFDQFNSNVLSIYPFLLSPIRNIWGRLLVDQETASTSVPSEVLAESGQFQTHSLRNRAHLAILYAILGPIVLVADTRLFQATSDGFSIYTFESKTTAETLEPGPSIVIVQGREARSGHSKKQKITYAIFVDAPWRASAKKTFGEERCFIIELEPEVNVWPLARESVFLARPVGFGAGWNHPPKPGQMTEAPGPALVVNNALKTATFHHAFGAGSRHTFGVDQVEVYGCSNPDGVREPRRQ